MICRALRCSPSRLVAGSRRRTASHAAVRRCAPAASTRWFASLGGDEQIEDEMYEAVKFYISSSTDNASLEDAVSYYTGEKYIDNVEKLYQERKEQIENGKVDTKA